MSLSSEQSRYSRRRLLRAAGMAFMAAILAVTGVAVVGAVRAQRRHDPATALGTTGGHQEAVRATITPTSAPSSPGGGAPGAPPASFPPPRPSRFGSVDPSPAQLLAGAQPYVPSGWTASVHVIPSGGHRREYLTIQPDHAHGPLPVVILLHGRFMTADGILATTRLAAQVGPAVLVVPEGWHRSWDAGRCCGIAYTHHSRDTAFVHAALDQVLASTPAADPSQVYAVGFSNGGRMAYRLACELPGVLAGIVVAEAVPVLPCPSLRPLDIAVIAQADDPLLSVRPGQAPVWIDGFKEPTVSQTVDAWRALDGCGAGRSSAAGVASVHAWSCAAGSTFEYVRYPGGYHSWREPAGATPGATDVAVAMIRGRERTTL